MERLTYRGSERITEDGLIRPSYSDYPTRRIIDKLAQYEDLEEIFRDKMTNKVCEFLKDKDEFGKWIDRNKWIAKKCDEYARAE